MGKHMGNLSKKVKSRILGKNYYSVSSGDYLNNNQSNKVISRILGKSVKSSSSSISAPVYIGGKLLSGIAGIAEGVYDFTAGTLDICWFTTGTPNITTV